jgi:hypothetical protein
MERWLLHVRQSFRTLQCRGKNRSVSCLLVRFSLSVSGAVQLQCRGLTLTCSRTSCGNGVTWRTSRHCSRSMSHGSILKSADGCGCNAPCFSCKFNRAVSTFLSDAVNSFLGQAVLSAFASLDQEEQAPVVCTGSLTAGFSAALPTEGPCKTTGGAGGGLNKPTKSGEG